MRLSWDYRAPAIDNTFWNVSKEARSFKIGDKDIYVAPQTIAVAVSVPARSDTNDWWKPAAMSLTLAPDGSFSPMTKVTLDDGTELNFNKIWSTPSRRTLQPVAGYQEVAGKFVYFFDISDLASASYVATYSVSNTAGNDSSYTEPESKLILSDEPSVSVFKDGSELVKRDQVYFLNEIVIAAFQGEEGVADIKSVVIDNVMASYTPTNVKGIYRLKPMPSLETNKVHTLTVVAENVNGISKTYSIDFTYMPMTFTLKSIESASTI
ncbi:Ig-like domain-containing protein, partial [Klebsiella pneumoniae]|nr:Ig-like domain-containing protein [Klebsiella pneumoniae]